MNNTKAIFIKQLTSLIKAPSMIVQGIMFLIIAAIFAFFIFEDAADKCETCIPAYVCTTCEEEAADRFEIPVPSGIGLFAVVFVGLALVGSTSAQVLEDKTTTNLRFMAMSGVRPHQYLIGTLASMVIVVGSVLVLYALVGRYFGIDMFWFMAVGIFGGLVSIMLGIVIGLSKVPALATPFSIVLGLGPTLAPMNETLANALRFTFIQQVNIAFGDLSADLTSNFLIIGINGAVILLIFILMHRKNRFNL